MFSRILEIITTVMEGVADVFWLLTGSFTVLGYEVNLFDIFTTTGIIAFLIIVLPRFFSSS